MKKTAENYKRKWSEKDIAYLEKYFGVYSIQAIAKKLKRTPEAIITKKNRLGLGGARLATTYITVSELASALGRSKETVKRWIDKYELPATHKVILSKAKYSRIDVKKFWKWSKEHDKLMKWNLYNKGSLDHEPEWLEIAIKSSYKSDIKNKDKIWSKLEDCYLMEYYKNNMSYKEMAKRLNRTTSAIDGRLRVLGVKKTRKIQIKWTSKEVEILKSMLNKNKSYEEIAEELGRSLKGVSRKAEEIKKATKNPDQSIHSSKTENILKNSTSLYHEMEECQC